MIKIFPLILTLALSYYSAAQGLYDISNITLIELQFDDPNWDATMDTYYENGLDERLIGSCTINGQLYDSVGVAFKGNSTYSPTNLKNPLNIKLNHVLEQKYQGYSSLKLSNGSKDPSFVREVLSYEIGRQYMDMPLANYAKVMINGSYYGLFSSAESINSDYHERRLYCDDDNTRIKCNPASVFDGGSSLEYLGTDSSDYFDFYELKSDFGWNDLVDFTYALQTDLPNIETQLDVDRVLWMLAFNSVLVNLDSYTGPFKQNYYMIKDDNDRFLPIIWDLNQSIGSFSMLGDGPPGPGSITDLIEMDLFLREDDPSFPLIYKLFSVPRYRKMYVAHVKTMLAENFSDGSYYSRAEDLQDIIAAEVGAEPNGFYSTTQFNNNLDNTVTGGGGPGGGVYGLSELMDPRVSYLEGLPEWSYVAPTISAVTQYPTVVPAYTTVTITAVILDASYAYLGYRNDWQDAFEKMEMFDDGLHGDGAAGDLVYGVSIPLTTKDIQYYIYADNANAGKFSPERAEHEFYNLMINSNVVINEIMPANVLTIADQDGEFDDWIELYNTTASAIDLSGYYLSDRPNANPLMWQIPEGTSIEPNGYLIIWADEDTAQTGLHANFKLSSSGESVAFSDPSGFQISRVKMPEMDESTTYGRYPNATGPFMRMFPTFAAENSFTALSIKEEKAVTMEVLLYPNPAKTEFTVQFLADAPQEVMVYDLQGQCVYVNAISSNTPIDISSWSNGLYLVIFPEYGISQKLVKNE